jgi:outer membrane beta-barrel protein
VQRSTRFRRIAAGLLLPALTALAVPAAAFADGLPSEAPLPSCLDRTIKDELGRTLEPRGVQKRTFLKKGKVALAARGGLYAGDLTSSSWIAGGALAYFLTEDLGLQASLEVTPVALELERPLADFFGGERFAPGLGVLALGALVWSPIHAKMKIGGGIVHADILASAGAGRLVHDSVQGVTFVGGLALEMFTSRRVTLKLELRDVMAVQEAVAQTRFTHNLVTTASVAVWLPAGR